MTSYNVLVEAFMRQYPRLAMNISGPWPQEEGSQSALPWLCTFHDLDNDGCFVHAGSYGADQEDALRNGMDYLVKLAASSQADDQTQSPSKQDIASQ